MDSVPGQVVIMKPSLERFFSVFLLLIHMGYLLMFFYLQVSVMFYLNIFSVMLYATMLFFVKRNHMMYVMFALLEICIHSLLGIICTGFETGFTFYLLVIIQSLYYYNYQLIRLTGKKHLYPEIGLSVIVTIGLGVTVFIFMSGPLYPLERYVNYGFLISNFLIGSLFSILLFISYEHSAMQTQRNLEFMAMSDELTGLYNRWHMMKMMEQCEASGQEYAIGIFDIDDFKQVNDTYGHAAGDLVLRRISDELDALMDEHTYICRWGGEEFLIMSTGARSVEEICTKMEGFIQNIHQREYQYEDTIIKVSVTAGVASRKKVPGYSMDHVIRDADDLLYKGKQAGKNRLVREEALNEVEKISLT